MYRIQGTDYIMECFSAFRYLAYKQLYSITKKINYEENVEQLFQFQKQEPFTLAITIFYKIILFLELSKDIVRHLSK